MKGSSGLSARPATWARREGELGGAGGGEGTAGVDLVAADGPGGRGVEGEAGVTSGAAEAGWSLLEPFGDGAAPADLEDAFSRTRPSSWLTSVMRVDAVDAVEVRPTPAPAGLTWAAARRAAAVEDSVADLPGEACDEPGAVARADGLAFRE